MASRLNDLLKLKRRIGGVAQFHVVDWTGHLEHDVHALGLRFQTQIENRFDADRIVEGDGSVIHCVSGSEEDQLAFGDEHAPQHARIGHRSTHAQIGGELHILRQRGLHAQRAGAAHANVEPHSLQTGVKAWRAPAPVARPSSDREPRSVLSGIRNLFHGHGAGYRAVIGGARKTDVGRCHHPQALLDQRLALGMPWPAVRIAACRSASRNRSPRSVLRRLPP